MAAGVFQVMTGSLLFVPPPDPLKVTFADELMCDGEVLAPDVAWPVAAA
jgi:hypothetical protein